MKTAKDYLLEQIPTMIGDNYVSGMKLTSLIALLNGYAKLYALSNPLEQSEKKEEWVSVETDYPLDFEPVLVFTINKDIQIRQLQKYGDDIVDAEWCDVDSLDNDKDIDFVTHWRKLPQLPKINL